MEISLIIGRIELKVSYFYDADLWDTVIDGYTHPLDTNGAKMERSNMNDQQKSS